MFEKLTAFIPALQRENFGDYQTIVEEYCNGGNFGETARHLQTELSNFVEEHPEFDLTHYNIILKENGLWGGAAMEQADVETLDGQLIMAFLVSIWRIDRLSCWGTLFAYFYESGHILKWLERLKAIDEAS